MARTSLVVAGLLILGACSGSPGSGRVPVDAPAATADVPVSEEDAPPSRPSYGFALSPRTFGADDFEGFFQMATEAGDLVSWAGDWQELKDDRSGAAVVMELADRYGYTPLIAAGPPDGGRAAVATMRGAPAARTLDGIVGFAERHRPPYLALGVEMNLLWEADPESFDRYVDLFEEGSAQVRAVSPETRLFPVFQLERLRGLRGGVFGGSNDPGAADWGLLDRFPSADLIGFTTYPGLVFGHPDEIPDDYYVTVAERLAGPMAIIETGWHAVDGPPGFQGTPERQARYVERLFELTGDLPLEMAVWLHLYDQPGAPMPFGSMGLFDGAGESRPAWEVWRDNVAP